MRNFGVRLKIFLDGGALPVERSWIKWFQRIDFGKEANVEYFDRFDGWVSFFST